mmetsp:Transcript_2852/g.7256  ORF Transcript_2852/g.7256 Transcript_2852/m.7256 type:complete len:607 (+) Transcript_2852:89-1909(+)
MQRRTYDALSEDHNAPEDAVALRFDDLDFAEADVDAFEVELKEQFRQRGVPDYQVDQYSVRAHDDKQIAEILCKDSAALEGLREMLRRNLEPIIVMGSAAEVADLEEVRVTAWFRPVAWGIMITFLLTMLTSAVATYQFSEFTPETDLITVFYGTFNPCIWFDHYPAKILACLGMGLVIVLSVMFTGMLFLFEYCERNVSKTLIAAIVGVSVCLIDVMLVNVFTTNLYPLARRLHGVHKIGNNTISLIQLDPYNRTVLDETETDVVLLHTSFYVGWIMAEFLMSVHVAWFAWVHSRVWSPTKRFVWCVVLAIGWLGMLLHAFSMILVIIYRTAWITVGDDSNGWHSVKSVVQQFIWEASTTLLVAGWGWIPIFYFRFVIPPGTGVVFTFRKVASDKDHGEVRPVRFVTRCFCLLLLIGVCGGVFTDVVTEDPTTMFKLLSGMRTKPYAYYAAPAHLAAVVLGLLGILLTIVQQRLANGKWPVVVSIAGAFMFLSMYCGTLLILEREHFTWIFGLFFFVSYLFWVLALNQDRDHGIWIPVVYCLCGIVLLYLSIRSDIIFCFLWYIWLTLYPFVVPNSDHFYITLSQKHANFVPESSEEEEEEEEFS